MERGDLLGSELEDRRGFHWYQGRSRVQQAIRRINSERRWSKEDVLGVRGVAWHRDLELEEPTQRDGRVLPSGPSADVSGIPAQSDPKIRRMRLRREDFEAHGFTTGCQGCRAIIRHVGPQPHSQPCRRRIEDILKNTEEGQRRTRIADERMNEHLAKRLEEEDKKSNNMKTSDADPKTGSAIPQGGIIDERGIKHDRAGIG